MWLAQKRSFPGKRWFSIGLRCLHLVGICGLAGAYLFEQPEAVWHPYLLMTVISGALMMAKEVYSDMIWLYQLRGQIIFFKLLLLAVGLWWFESPEAGVFIVVVVLSGIIAHAPGKVRYYSLWHRQVITRELIEIPVHEVKDCGES